MERQNQNIRLDPVQTWLDNVAFSHSGSNKTTDMYRRNFSKFLEFIGKSADDIIEEYKRSTDREFRRTYAQYLKAWIAALSRKDLTNSTINIMVGSVRSFFKYSDLILGFIPTAMKDVVYHNRDIEKEELVDILKNASIRDRAFYAVMAQSGLRPITLCQLRLKHLQPDLDKGTVPLKIDVPKEIAKGKYKGYSFIGSEAIGYLKDYLKTRRKLMPDSHVFLDRSGKPTVPRAFSVQFNKLVRKLRSKGVLDFTQKKAGKPSELRLYNLRKFFKKHSHEAGEEYNEFWMGHKGRGATEHYLSRDVEFHRELYKEKAMPYLRIEAKTPIETEGLIKELRHQLKEARSDLEILQTKHDVLYGMYQRQNEDSLDMEARIKELEKKAKKS